MDYDVIVIGAGPGGIFTAYELSHAEKKLKTAPLLLGLSAKRCLLSGFSYLQSC